MKQRAKIMHLDNRLRLQRIEKRKHDKDRELDDDWLKRKAQQEALKESIEKQREIRKQEAEERIKKMEEDRQTLKDKMKEHARN